MTFVISWGEGGAESSPSLIPKGPAKALSTLEFLIDAMDGINMMDGLFHQNQ